MRTVIVASFLALCLQIAYAGPDEDWDKKFQAAVAKCKVEHNLDDGIIKKLMDRVIPTTQNGKCGMLCIMDELGYVEDDRITTEMLKADNLLRYTPKQVEIASKINEMCVKKGIDEDDDCEAAYIVTDCIVKEYDNAGLKI